MTFAALRNKIFGNEPVVPPGERTVVLDCSDDVTDDEIRKIEEDVRPAIEQGKWEPVEECGW